jgi:hypothetical protein
VAISRQKEVTVRPFSIVQNSESAQSSRMTTTELLHRLHRFHRNPCFLMPGSRLVIRFLFVIVIALCVSGLPAHAARRPEQGKALTGQYFFCNTGYDRQECAEDIARLKAVLSSFPVSAARGWSWVIVRSEDWEPLALRLHLDRRSPAFTALNDHETVLEEALFSPNQARAGELVQDFHTPLDQLLLIAVSHEIGHAICRSGDEVAMNRFGDQLRRGKYPKCDDSGVSLSFADEGYLQRRLPGSGR